VVFKLSFQPSFCKVKKMEQKFYDHDGKEISVEEWKKIFESNVKIAITQEDFFLICTLYMGLDMSRSKNCNIISDKEDKIHIFETSIIPIVDQDENCKLNSYKRRYATKEKALKGHEEAVQMVKYFLKQEKKNV
jgi:hypothetical protein